jgi:CVNH domain.
MRITAALFAVLCIAGSPALGQASSFQRSCQNISLHEEPNGVAIFADCDNGVDGYANSWVELTGIHNIFGRLESDYSRGASSYQRSCQNSYLSWTPTNVYLHSVCGNGSGGWTNSVVEVLGIHNRNGRLIAG